MVALLSRLKDFSLIYLGAKKLGPVKMFHSCLAFRVTRCVYEKMAQNVAQPIFCSKYIPILYLGKKIPNFEAISVIFINLPEVNNCPMKVREIWSPCLPLTQVDFCICVHVSFILQFLFFSSLPPV
jgi:hypothetical protein